jgi:protein CpxP
MSKKKLGVLAFAFALTAAVTAPLQAQGRGQGGGMSIDDQMAQLTTALSLTDEQVGPVRELLEMQNERRQELRSSAGGDREAMRAAMMEMQEETSVQLKEILTEEQMTKYTELVAPRRGGPPPFYKSVARGPPQGRSRRSYDPLVCDPARRAERVLARPRSTSTTAPTISTAPNPIWLVTISSANSHPSRTATTGFT